MEKRGFTPPPGQPSDGAKGPRQPEQVTEQYVAPAAPTESRMTDPAVDTDGQLVEAGYGHGV